LNKPEPQTELTLLNLVAIGMIEGVITILGFIVIIFPLALWAVPQHGVLANTVFYIVLSVGCGSFVSLIGLVYLKSRLFPGHSPQGMPTDEAGVVEDRMQAYLTWSQTQEDARKVERQLRTMKGSALHNLGYMTRIASLLATVVTLLYLGTWAFMDFYYGSTEVLSAEARWELLHPDNWGWK
jgi:hypothetical protein